MALTEWYVRPDDNDTNGDGSSGDPYGDFQALLDNEAMSSSGGTRINVSDQNGTHEILAAVLDFATTFFVTNSPGLNNRLIIEGYTSAAGDGGIGILDGNALYSIAILNTKSYITLRNLRLTNCGSATYMFRGGLNCVVENVECDDHTGSVGINLGNYSIITNGYFHNTANIAAQLTIGCVIRCRFEDGTNKFTGCLSSTAPFLFVEDCTFWCNSTGTTYVILHRDQVIVKNSSFYNNAACTNPCIKANATSQPLGIIENNLFEGWSGVGGACIEAASASQSPIVRGNRYSNVTAFLTNSGQVILAEDNSVTTASPFTDAANKDFRPVDADGVKEGSVPAGIGLY